MKQYKIQVEGTVPLLLHNPQSMLEEKKNKRGAIPSPQDEANAGLYLNKNGKIVIPGEHFLGSMKESAVDFHVPGKGRKTYKFYIESGLEIENDPEIVPQQWEIDLRTVVLGGKRRIIRSRPKFDNWKAEFIINVLDEATFIDSHDKMYGGGANVRDILVAAGKFKGVGDYHPKFGRFEVTKFERIDN